jgi:ABC-type Mn2+/Zn2+ transport system permease subunit
MQALQFLEVLVGYVVCGIVALFGILLIWKIATNEIDLSHLLSDDDGMASTSRFQLVIFTFVVALSFFLVVVSNIKVRQYDNKSENVPGFPEVPAGVLSLLGISASSYLVSRGISASQDDSSANAKTPTPPPAGTPPATGTKT